MNKINKKILVIEDDKQYISILKENFLEAGFDVIVAEDGETGLAMAEKEKPDLILLDILLPKMDGIAVAKRLLEKDIKIPIIFLTNFGDAQHISEAVEITENTEYIIKADFHVAEIIDRVKKRLKIK